MSRRTLFRLLHPLSLASRVLRLFQLTPSHIEVDSLEALANHEIDAAAVTPTIAAYFNLTHPDKAVRILGPDESEANLNWNVAVGMVRPDEKLRDAIEAAIERLRADGTVERIYGRYGIVLQSPR
jgi:polar amino acid transport system substrate-binding protein